MQLAKDMGLDKAKAVETPASKEAGKNERNVDRLLKDKDAKWFRQMAGTALYLSLDWPTIQFADSQLQQVCRNQQSCTCCI